MIWVALFIGLVLGLMIAGMISASAQKQACKCLEDIQNTPHKSAEQIIASLTGEKPCCKDDDTCCKNIEAANPITASREKAINIMSGSKPKEFELYKDAANEFRWRLRAKNGKIIATSNDGYINKADAESAISIVKNAASETEVQDLT